MKYSFLFFAFALSCSGNSNRVEDPSHDKNQPPPTPTEVVPDNTSEEEVSPASPGDEDKPDEEPAAPVVVELPVRHVRWTWPLPLDEGLRDDPGGAGWFGAPRGTRRHSGLDLKAPMNTPVLAICPGYYITGDQRPYGKFVKIICQIPKKNLWVSVLYAHLSSVVEATELTQVRVGDEVGAVGKSGNASDDEIEPHLHIEIRVWPIEDSARDDIHSLRDSGPEYDWTGFETELSECTDLSSKVGPRQDHKFDPFYLLLCYGNLPPRITESWTALYQEL